MAVLWRKKSDGNKYKVTRAGNAVRLYRNSVLHSQWNSANPVSGHLWDLFLLSSLDGDLNNVLVLGAGGGAVINLIHYFFPNAKIDAVELDKYHIHVAKKYFKINTKNCILYQDDVRQWVKNNKRKKYDLVIDDVFFEGKGIPYRSIDAHSTWICQLLSLLNKKGRLVINFADNKEWKQSKKQLEKLQHIKPYNFAIAQQVQCDNRVIHVSKDKLSLNLLRKSIESAPFDIFNKSMNKKLYQYKSIKLKVK